MMQRKCAFPLCIFSSAGIETSRSPSTPVLQDWIHEWKGSQLHEDLVQALKKHESTMRTVKKIVCCGIDDPASVAESLYGSGRRYIHPLIASTIAKTLAEIYLNNANVRQNIEIFSQDPFFEPTDEAMLKTLHPPVTMVKFESYDVLTLIDRNTFIVAMCATSPIVEPALDFTGLYGPAGLLHQRVEVNGDVEWDGEKKSNRSPHNTDWATESDWTYKQSCIREPVTDDIWLGDRPFTPRKGVKKGKVKNGVLRPESKPDRMLFLQKE
jgi:hypothetical protein